MIPQNEFEWEMLLADIRAASFRIVEAPKAGGSQTMTRRKSPNECPSVAPYFVNLGAVPHRDGCEACKRVLEAQKRGHAEQELRKAFGSKERAFWTF